MRCEGYTRHGGMMTLGPVVWTQCSNEAVVNITAEQEGVTKIFPMCLECWQKGIDAEIKILNVVPIENKDQIAPEPSED